MITLATLETLGDWPRGLREEVMEPLRNGAYENMISQMKQDKMNSNVPPEVWEQLNAGLSPQILEKVFKNPLLNPPLDNLMACNERASTRVPKK